MGLLVRNANIQHLYINGYHTGLDCFVFGTIQYSTCTNKMRSCTEECFARSNAKIRVLYDLRAWRCWLLRTRMSRALPVENDCGTEEILVPKSEVPTGIRDAHKNIEEVLPCKSVYTSFATVSCFYHQLSLSTIRSDDVRACKEEQ